MTDFDNNIKKLKNRKKIMAKTMSMKSVRKAIAYAYSVDVDNIPEELEDQFINLSKAA